MKRNLLLCLALCISVLANAQATDLVIDCQTPGWLSSKINYGDQQTVKNLKVTGYINATDLKFIGTLINSRNLDGELDLSEVNIVSSTSGGKDNKLVDLGLSRNDSIRVYRIPKSVTEVSSCINNLHVDTMYFDCKMRYIDCRCFAGANTDISHLHVGESVDSLPGQNLINNRIGIGFIYINGIKSIRLPKTIKKIEECCFFGSGIENINIDELSNLDYLGKHAFRNTNYTPDTLIIPIKLKDFNASSFSYKNGQHIFLSKNVQSIGTGADLKFTYGFGKNLIFHMESSNPPSGHAPDKTCTVYVPKGAKENYYHSAWGEATIIELNPVVNVTLNAHNVVMNKNESTMLFATIIPDDADDMSINWNSGNDAIATVNDNGLVKAISEGQTYVYATSIATGVKDSCLVTVRKNVESVEFEEKEIVISDIGDTKQLIVTIVPDDATEKSVTWNSSNEQVCTVSANGLVTAVGAGSSVITVTTVDGGHTATCLVKVLQHVSSLALSKHSLSLKVGEQEQLRAIIMPDNADDKNTIWSSSDNHVATIDDNGNITALKAGEAWIKAVSLDNSEAKDSCKVKVVQPVTGISLSQENYQLTNIGENVQLEATVSPADATNKEVKWTSSNEAVCVVSNGKVIATGFGTAVVLAITVDGGFMASCTVIVEKESVTVTSVTISQTSATLSKGETLQLYATALPDDATNKTLVWKSSDEEICVVTQSGLLIAMNEGKAVITVVPQYGAGQAQCSVTVWNEVTTIEDIQIDHQSNAPIYDVTGRKVSRVVKNHLYIQNGKKFIAK